MGGSRVSPIIPEPPPPEAKTNLRCSPDLLQDLDDCADIEGMSRNNMMVHFLGWAVEQYRKAKGIKDLRSAGEAARKGRSSK
jgi:hypothetical protein